MGFWQKVGDAGIAVTLATGVTLVRGGAKAVKGAVDLYSEYKKDPTIDVKEKIINNTFDGIADSGNFLTKMTSELYNDCQKEHQQKELLNKNDTKEVTNNVYSNITNTTSTNTSYQNNNRYYRDHYDDYDDYDMDSGDYENWLWEHDHD